MDPKNEPKKLSPLKCLPRETERVSSLAFLKTTPNLPSAGSHPVRSQCVWDPLWNLKFYFNKLVASSVSMSSVSIQTLRRMVVLGTIIRLFRAERPVGVLKFQFFLENIGQTIVKMRFRAPGF